MSVPDAPLTVVATANGSSAITISWFEPPDGGSTILRYRVERESPIGGGFNLLIEAVAAEFATQVENLAYGDSGLAAGTQYNYRVYAINGEGTSAASAAADATTEAAAYDHDGSIASLTEAWLVARIKTSNLFANGLVEVWMGSDAPNPAVLAAELTKHRSPYVGVLFEGDSPVELEEGQQRYNPVYGIYIAMKNERPGAARKGDGTTPGTNLIRDTLRNLLHNAEPATTANGFFTDRLTWRGLKLLLQSGDVSIMRAEVMGMESPTA